MSTLTFSTLRQQVMQLYRAQEYARVLELVEREQGQFPGYAYRLAYWRLSMHVLLGKQTEALRIFRETLARGDWFAPHVLEHDPDLDPLRPLTDFQEMVEICRQRLAQLRASGVQPELLIQGSEGSVVSPPVLIAMHGNAGNASTTLENWSGIAAYNWLLAAPQSSQIVGPGEYVWDNRELSTSEIREHLATLTFQYGIDAERVILGGFSMGGGQAIWMALHQLVKTPGFVVLGPYLRANELEALSTLLATQKPASMRGYILIGDEDSECLEISRKVVALLHAHELPCELELLPGQDHSYPADFVKLVTKGLTFVEQR
ncbi:MAG TPA: hypothetical protein VGD98_10055 [Ktedonobacteraceae bacterium]